MRRLCLVVAIATFLPAGQSAAATKYTATWVGPADGQWTDAGNWSFSPPPPAPTDYPTNTGAQQFIVAVDGGGSAASHPNLADSVLVDQLLIDADDRLDVRGFGLLEVMPGTQFIDGVLNLADDTAIPANARLRLTGDTTLSGTGRLVFGSGGTGENNIIDITSSISSLTIDTDFEMATDPALLGEDPTAYGLVIVPLINHGRITADAGTIDLQHDVTNHSELHVRNGGRLNLTGLTLTNDQGGGDPTVGQVVVDGSASLLGLGQTTVIGGRISGSGGVEVVSATVLRDVVLDVAAFTSLNLTSVEGSLTNNSTITLDGINHNVATLRLTSGDLTIDGNGAIHFGSPATGRLHSNGHTLTLAAGQTVRTSVSGARGRFDLDLINHGIISADAGTIDFEVGHSISQLGTMQAINGGGLRFVGGNTIHLAGRSISADAGSTIELTSATINGGSIDGAGTLYLGGQHRFDGVVLNIAQTQLDQNNTLQIANGLTNHGAIMMTATSDGGAKLRLIDSSQQIAGSGNLTFAGPFETWIDTADDNLALTHGIGHTLSVAAGASGRLAIDTINDGTLHLDGTLAVASGRTLTNSTTGMINGGGTLELADGQLTNHGTIAPGNSTGSLTITGNVASSDTSVLSIEIAGAGAGQADLLTVGGTFALDGILEVTLPGSPTLLPTDQILILQADALTGSQFDQVVGFGEVFSVVYDLAAGQVWLTHFGGSPEPIVGDLTGDGFVDDADLQLLFEDWKGDGSINNSDLNGDNLVNDFDLGILLGNWTGSGETPIPEPTSMLMLGGIGGWFVTRRCISRR